MRNIIRKLIPASLRQLLGTLIGGNIGFHGNFTTWEEASSRCGKYSEKTILDKVTESTLKVKTGEAACERDSVIFETVQYSWPTLAGILYAAACSQDKLNVLDFGGSLGSSYFQNRKFLNGLNCHWSIVEQPHFCECGERLIADQVLDFHTTIDACVAVYQPNLVLLSSTLQYLETPYAWLEKLCQVNAQTLIIDRTSFSPNSQESIKIQHVPKAIYKASYPFWILDKAKVIALLNQYHYQVIETFDAPFAPVSKDIQFQGLITKKQTDHDNKNKKTP